MLNFFKKILIFLIGPVSIIILLEISISVLKYDIFDEESLEYHFISKVNNYHWVRLINSDSIRVLSGSSSVRYGLSCDYLNTQTPSHIKFVNIADDARDPIETYFILKNFDLNKVSVVYFAIDPWIFAKRYYKYRNEVLYIDFDFLQTINYYKEHDKFAFFKRYEEMIKHIFNLSEQVTQKNYTIPNGLGSRILEREAKNFNVGDDWFQINRYGWSDLQFL